MRPSISLRLMSILLLAGCASSEPQNASYAPLPGAAPLAPAVGVAPPPAQAVRMPAASPAPMTSPVPAASQASLNGPIPVDASAPVVPKALQEETGLIPPTGDGAATEAVLPPGATNCSTVDGVTLCDAPADASTDNLNLSGDDDGSNTN